MQANYLASPPLVVAYALAGTMNIDLTTEPLGTGTDGKPVYLKDIWPTNKEIADIVARRPSRARCSRRSYADVFKGDDQLAGASQTTDGDTYDWDAESTYVQNPPYFDGMHAGRRRRSRDIVGARILGLFGDKITTDHISPAGSIKADSPAGKYLIERTASRRPTSTRTARAAATTK